MRRLLPLTFLLTGCMAHSSVRAPANALACAERIANGLGYTVTSRSSEGGEGSFVAQQPVMGDAAEPAIGVISASVWRDSEQGTRLAVRGDRYRERRNGAAMNPPVLGPTAGRPPVLGPATPSRTSIGARNPGRYRISPGPVAEDARLVRQQCGGAEERVIASIY